MPAESTREFRVSITSSDIPLLSGPAYNVWHIRNDAAVPSLAGWNAANVDLAAFYTAMAPWFTNGTGFLVGDRVVTVGADPNTYEGVTPIAIAGTDTGPATAAQLAALLTYRGAVIGASHRGRKYIGPLEQTAIDSGGQISATLITALLAAYDGLVSALAANSEPCVVGVYSRLFDQFSQAVTRTVSIRPATLASRS